MLKKFLEEFKQGTAFDFIKNEGHNFNKQELIDIIAELVYAIDDSSLLDIEKKEIMDIFEDNLYY